MTQQGSGAPRDVLSSFWSPLCAIGARGEGGADAPPNVPRSAPPNAQICVSVFGASIVPEQPRVLVSLSKTNYTHELVIASGTLSVTALSASQLPLLEPLGLRSGRDGDKLAGLEVALTEAGDPWFPGCRRLPRLRGDRAPRPRRRDGLPLRRARARDAQRRAGDALAGGAAARGRGVPGALGGEEPPRAGARPRLDALGVRAVRGGRSRVTSSSLPHRSDPSAERPQHDGVQWVDGIEGCARQNGEPLGPATRRALPQQPRSPVALGADRVESVPSVERILHVEEEDLAVQPQGPVPVPTSVSTVPVTSRMQRAGVVQEGARGSRTTAAAGPKARLPVPDRAVRPHEVQPPGLPTSAPRTGTQLGPVASRRAGGRFGPGWIAMLHVRAVCSHRVQIVPSSRKAMRVPSGDQAGARVPLRCLESCR